MRLLALRNYYACAQSSENKYPHLVSKDSSVNSGCILKGGNFVKKNGCPQNLFFPPCESTKRDYFAI